LAAEPADRLDECCGEETARGCARAIQSENWPWNPTVRNSRNVEHPALRL